MAVVNVTPAAHAAAKQAAERAGMSLGAWASERLQQSPRVIEIHPTEGMVRDAGRVVTNRLIYGDLRALGEENVERLSRMALERAESPSETLSAALAALAAPRGIQPPETASYAGVRLRRSDRAGALAQAELREADMTPAERGERAARICSCKSCRPRLARVVEAEIREAAKPLVEALREMVKAREAMKSEPGLMTPVEWFQRAYERAEEEWAKWAE